MVYMDTITLSCVSFLKPPGIFASHATPEFGEVVFRPQIVSHFSVIRFLYNINVSLLDTFQLEQFFN